MEARLSILFYGKKTRNESDKILSIYLRVTINGNRFEVSTQRCVETDKWSSTAGKVKGNTEEVRKTNQYLDNVKQKVYDYQKKILQDGKPFTKETLRLEWYGLNEHIHSLVEVFTNHNNQMEALIGKDNSKATFGKYRTTLDHTISFLKWKFQRSDIEISSITYSFITEFEFWLKSVQKCNHNTTIKYISNLRKIINICLKKWMVSKRPFYWLQNDQKRSHKRDSDRGRITNTYGKLPLDKESKAIRRLLAECNAIKGKEYRDEVMQWLTGNTHLVVYPQEITIKKKGFFVADTDKGDIDILAIDRERKIIYSIECKNTSQSKVAYEFHLEIIEYLGQPGKVGLIQKHVKRDLWLHENREHVLQKLKVGADYGILSLVISNHVLPTAFLRTIPIATISFYELKQSGLPVPGHDR